MPDFYQFAMIVERCGEETNTRRIAMQYSKGVWKLNDMNQIGIPIQDTDEEAYAWIDLPTAYDWSEVENELGNARLIRSAPELLEALEALFENCVMVHKNWGDNSNQRQADAAIEKARAAIAKAKGEWDDSQGENENIVHD